MKFIKHIKIGLLGSLLGLASVAALGQSTTLTANGTSVLSIAEEIYPTLLVNGGALKVAQGYLYRYYSGSSVYIGFKDGRVFVVGGPFGDRILDKGPEATVVTALQTARTKIQERAALGTLPALPANAGLTGFREAACSEEGTIKSLSSSSAAAVKITNSTSARVKFFWLDFTGKRVEYAKVNAGSSFSISSFQTHPWLVANDQDSCLGIYVPKAAGNVTIALSKSVPGATGDSYADRATKGIECLVAKGDNTNATAVRGLLNVYLLQKKLLGSELAYQGYLSAGVDVLNKQGC